MCVYVCVCSRVYIYWSCLVLTVPSCIVGDLVEAVVPFMGESITDGTLANFLKSMLFSSCIVNCDAFHSLRILSYNCTCLNLYTF
jgi:type III secretory pathway component EscS